MQPLDTLSPTQMEAPSPSSQSESSRQTLLKKYGPRWQSNLVSHVEAISADLAQPDDCKRICEGVMAVYHVGPGFHPRETKIGYVHAYVSYHQGNTKQIKYADKT
ncbi:hypothetical protein ABVK25_011757 [Lepraria finkii]|uniref:Uncharacterized protein n=1 Tax=Lepraria finkii TaxID=1340010 RepID=A0ABR4ALE7_9LECA